MLGTETTSTHPKYETIIRGCGINRGDTYVHSAPEGTKFVVRVVFRVDAARERAVKRTARTKITQETIVMNLQKAKRLWYATVSRTGGVLLCENWGRRSAMFDPFNIYIFECRVSTTLSQDRRWVPARNGLNIIMRRWPSASKVHNTYCHHQIAFAARPRPRI